MSQRPTFRPIAPPLDVDDGTLARLADQMGVPTLVKPGATGPAVAQEKPQDSPKPVTRPAPAERDQDSPAGKKPAKTSIPAQTALEKLTVELPGYLIDAVKRDALDRRSTARHVLMLALQGAGFTIHPADLVRDARRSRRKTARS